MSIGFRFLRGFPPETFDIVIRDLIKNVSVMSEFFIHFFYFETYSIWFFLCSVTIVYNFVGKITRET